MLDNDYRAAGNRLTGTVVGLGSSYAMPYLTKVPGLSYDVGAATGRAMWSLGETASLRTEQWMSDRGLILHAAPPGPRVIANKAAGDAWELDVINNVLPATQDKIQPQITIRSNGPSGLKVRLDALGENVQTGSTMLSDMKASATARYTPNQTIVYPELEIYGGVVVGKGKTPYVGGTQIPPSIVDIIRKP